MAAPWSFELLTGVPLIHHHALSPDGRLVAFVWQREGNSDLYVVSVDGSSSAENASGTAGSTPLHSGTSWPRRLTFDRPAQTFWSDEAPRWSPDSRSLVYAAQEDVWKVDVETGHTRKLTDFKHGNSSPIFSPDGRRVYFLSGRGTFENLCATSPEGDWPVALTHFQADVSDPQPSPDGSLVAFVYQPQEDLNRWEICIVPATGGDVTHLTGAAKVWDNPPRWSPDGEAIAFTSNRSGWQELYLLNLPLPLEERASEAHDAPPPLDSIHDSLPPPRRGTAKRGEGVQGLTQNQADIQDFAWRPDGLQIALVLNRQGTSDLCLLDVASGHLTVLRDGLGWHSRPQWSPDGRWLTVEFESPVAPPDIYQVDATTGAARPLTASMPPALAAASLVQPEFVSYLQHARSHHPCPAVPSTHRLKRKALPGHRLSARWADRRIRSHMGHHGAMAGSQGLCRVDTQLPRQHGLRPGASTRAPRRLGHRRHRRHAGRGRFSVWPGLGGRLSGSASTARATEAI